MCAETSGSTMRRCLLLVATVVALVASTTAQPALGAVEPGRSAHGSAAERGEPMSARAERGRVRGEILGPRGTAPPRVKVSWFTRDWEFLGTRKVYAGGYSLTLPAGTYRLQFVDQRPAYDTAKYRPVDATVRVRPAVTTVRTVRMKVGGSIGGTVRAGGRPAAGARVVAASPDERTFTTIADDRGNFALGGLPPGSYSVFTYDRRAQWVAKSSFVPKVRDGRFSSVSIRLTKRAGSLQLDIALGRRFYSGGGVTLTAISRATGQFWTARARGGSVQFRGLQPGRYRVVVPAIQDYLGTTVRVAARVRSGRTAFGSVRLTRQGARVTGRVVDRNRPENGLGGALVQLFAKDGQLLSRTTSRANGSFVLRGALRTQSGVRLVAGPSEESSYLGRGDSACRYASLRTTRKKLTAAQTLDLGGLGLPHLANSQQPGPQCHTEPARSTP